MIVALQPALGSWVTRPKPNPRAQFRLFCLPYAGSGASIFRTWPDKMPQGVEVCPIQLPGRENRLREAPFTQLSSLVQELARALLPYMDKPFAIFGHSMGALICFELSRHLRRAYEIRPLHLFVSGACAPHVQDLAQPAYMLPDADFLAKLRCFNGLPEDVADNVELMELLLPLLRADFTLCGTYVYSPEEPLDCSISAWGGNQDGEVLHEHLAAWRNHTQLNFSLRTFPGNHLFIQSAQSLVMQALSLELAGLLARATESYGS